MEYSSSLISGAANTVSNGLVWFEHAGRQCRLVAYLVSNAIAIVDDETTRVICTLRHDKLVDDKLTVLTVFHDVAGNKQYLSAGSEKGVVSLWSIASTATDLTQWTLEHTLPACKGSIASISTMLLSASKEVLVVVCDASGQAAVHLLSSNSLTHLQSIPFHPQQLPNTSHLMQLSSSTVLLCVGSVDAKIHLFVSHAEAMANSAQSVKFSLVGSLTGHEEWITSLSSLTLDDKTIFLASSSQDMKIRIWKFVQTEKSSVSTLLEGKANVGEELVEDEDDGEDIDEADGEDGGNANVIIPDDSNALSAEARLHFTAADDKLYLVFLESLLVGHEDWVTAVHWMHVDDLHANGDNAKLFSTSMDRNMVIWSPDNAAGGVWTPVVRVGDIGGALGGSVGGNLLGFVGGCPSPNGDAVMGIGYGGSFHYWKRQVMDVDSGDQRWFPRPFLTGHFGMVNDISWEATQGHYVTSVSSDQTCRIFGPIKHAPSSSSSALWKEVSRPEIHGYDLNCLVLSKSSYEILTGGEEKLIRGFDAPNLVLKGLQELCGIELPYPCSSQVEQAYIPELGLSNKGKDLMSNQEVKEQEARGVAAVDWKYPPLESQLADHTLWLETKKMFGHNNEVVCMAISACGKWLASCSKARYSHSCFILLWSLETHDLVAKLQGHDSTVVCLEFSPDGQYLASSGKDRSICIYKKTFDAATNSTLYVPALCLKNAHKRIVWDLSWSGDSVLLVTGARDGTCKVWKVVDTAAAVQDEPSVSLECIHTFSPFDGLAVTAVEIDKAARVSHGGWMLLLGAENGSMQWWKMAVGSGECSKVLSVSNQYCHSKAVKRLRWKPLHAGDERAVFEWASCGEDHTVRIHRVTASST